MNNLNQQLLPPPESICENCKLNDQLILHTIFKSQKSPPQKLCTSCVLSRYHKSFCAQCFQLHDVISLAPPPLTAATTTAGNNRFLSCSRCGNWAHIGCVRKITMNSQYFCPKCVSPKNYKYFDVKKSRKIDKEAAKQLVLAARIAVVVVAKAAAWGRGEAERKAKEAAVARKRAREAIDHFVSVSAKVGSVKTAVVDVPVPVSVVMPESNGDGAVAFVANGAGN